MLPRRTAWTTGPLPLLAALLGIGFGLISPRVVTAGELSLEPLPDFGETPVSAASHQSAAQPEASAKFFTINAVLAKLDRERGHGAGAIRLAALPPSEATATDASVTLPDAPSLKDAASAAKEPFGLLSFRAPDGALWRKWRGVEADMAKDQEILEQCRAHAESCPSHAAQFLRLINAVKAKSGRFQLQEANVAVNMAVRYVSDIAQHGEIDRWSSALATFATLKGDCEDYAIAKYVALREAGFPREQMQILLVRDRAVRQDHAVLAARIDDRWLILDNRRAALVEDKDATNLAPLFAVNHLGVQLIAAPFANRPTLEGEDHAAPAASAGATTDDWGRAEGADSGAGSLNLLPLLM